MVDSCHPCPTGGMAAAVEAQGLGVLTNNVRVAVAAELLPVLGELPRSAMGGT